jgi:uncharacterized protein YgiM (DUF1202 family)
MGLFDAFKNKAEKKTETVNPLYKTLSEAGFGINDMQVVNESGNVTVTGSVDDGSLMEKVNDFLSAQPGVSNVANNIEVADISGQGKHCKVVTKGSNLNVRAGASTSDDIVGRFLKDSEVLLIRRYNATWHQVRGVGIKGDVVEGYCHTDYIKEV